MTETPDVAVVIVNFRTPQLTCEAVASVLDQPEVSEVVVVDNASSDGSVAFLRTHLDRARVQLVESDVNLGFGKGVNLGFRHCTSPMLFALNSDAVLGPGSLGPLRAALVADDTIGVVAPAIYWTGRKELQPAHGVFPSLRTILLRTNHRPPETVWPDWVSGVAMLLRRNDFEGLGGFDPDLKMYLEDVDLCRRMRERGQRVHRELSASVFHALGQSCQDDDERFGWALQSRVVYARKACLPWPDRGVMRTLQALHSLRRMCGSYRRHAGRQRSGPR